jgi:hypothetical protein
MDHSASGTIIRMVTLSSMLLLFAGSTCRMTAGKKSDLVKISSVKTGYVYGVYVKNTIAYVSDNHGLLIIDVNDAGRPRFLGKVDLGEMVGDVFVTGERAFLAFGNELIISDVSDKTKPFITGRFKSNGRIESIIADEKLAFVGYAGNGIRILNIEDPAHLKEICHFATGKSCRGIAVKDHFLYAASTTGGLEIFDISKPEKPVNILTVPGTGGASGVYLKDNILAIGSFNNGIKLFDISDPVNPVLLKSLNNSVENRHVQLFDRFLITDSLNELIMYDITNPSDPEEIASYKTRKGIHDFFFDGRFCYSVFEELIILEFQEKKGIAGK